LSRRGGDATQRRIAVAHGGGMICAQPLELLAQPGLSAADNSARWVCTPDDPASMCQAVGVAY
jgi:hypothetical protein